MQWLIPPRLWLALLVTMIVGALLRAADPIAGPWLIWAGGALAALGVAVLLTAHRTFQRAETTVHTFHEPGEMVTDGLFAYSRNPMYLGFLTALLGVALALRDPLALLGPAVFWAAAQFWYIPFEERAAEARFGEAYRRRVRQWL